MTLETLAPSLLILFLNLVVGGILVALMRREAQRSDKAVIDTAQVKEAVLRFGLQFEHMQEGITKMGAAIDSLLPLIITVDLNERKLRVLERSVTRLQRISSLLKKRIDVLREATSPRICGEVWPQLNNEE